MKGIVREKGKEIEEGEENGKETEMIGGMRIGEEEMRGGTMTIAAARPGEGKETLTNGKGIRS